MWLFFQRTQVQFPILIYPHNICNSGYTMPSFCLSRHFTHMVHSHIHKQSTHKHEIKLKEKNVIRTPTYFYAQVFYYKWTYIQTYMYTPSNIQYTERNKKKER